MTAASVEREAVTKIAPYQGMVAWPTVWLALGIVVSFATVCTLCALGIWPLWVGLILNSFILYASQTPLHEACHGNIAGRDQRYMWLNHLIGYACGSILLHEYKAFRTLHLIHHRQTNDSEIDPDHWVKVKNPFRVLLRCLTIVFYYNHYFFKHVALDPSSPEHKRVAMHIIAMYFVYYTIAIWLCLFGYWREVLMLWIGPHILASALIIFFFAYLPHEPHQETDRYRDTNVFHVRGVWERAVNWLYLYQNYHLIHHLFPRIPFYLYPSAFKDLRPILESEHAHIFEYGPDDDRVAEPA